MTAAPYPRLSVWGRGRVGHGRGSNTLYRARALVMDPMQGIRRSAAVAPLHDVVRALLLHSEVAGRLNVLSPTQACGWVERTGRATPEMWERG